MNILNTLERRYGKYSISNLTQYLIIGQVIGYILMFTSPAFAQAFSLNASLVLQGEWWRIFTFLFAPISRDPIFAALTWYIYYTYGKALEREWGDFRYMVYLLLGALGAIVCAFLFPLDNISNTHIFTSLFLAFAYLFPDFKLYIFFIIPVKVKWLGLLAAGGLIASFLFGPTSTKVLVLLSFVNFFLFFGKELILLLQRQARGVKHVKERVEESTISYMECATCHATERDKKSFSYCHTCIPEVMYCEDHIKTHKHKTIN